MGIPTNAVYGFTSMLINQLRDEQPTHVGVAFDVSRRTFRNETYAEYKAGRSESPADFKGQVSLIQEVLAALRIPTVGVEGFEADDVIATLATDAREQGMEVLIATGDRDAIQLVDEHVTMLYPRRGVSELTRFTPEEVEAKYGLTPAQYPDFAALRGDPSDNLPSMPGVGEKTAAKWIREFGSLTALVERVDEVKGKAGDTLRAHVTSVLRNRQLTELVRSVPVPIGPQDLVLGQWDRDEVHKLFDNLQFRVLRERLFATLTAAQPEADSGFDVAGAELGPDEVPAWLQEHGRSGRRVGVSLRGTWGRGTGVVTGLGLAVEGGAPDDAAYVDAETLADTDERALVEWLGDARLPKAVHDLKGMLLALHARGWDVAGVTSDTALAAYLRPGGPGAALPAAGAAGGDRAGRRGPAHPGRRRGRGGRCGRRRAVGARPRDRRPRPGAGRRPGPARGHRAAGRGRAAADPGARGHGAHRDRCRPGLPGRPAGRVRRAGEGRRAGGVRQ